MKMVYLGIHKDVYDLFEEFRKSTCPEEDPTTVLNAVLYRFLFGNGFELESEIFASSDEEK